MEAVRRHGSGHDESRASGEEIDHVDPTRVPRRYRCDDVVVGLDTREEPRLVDARVGRDRSEVWDVADEDRRAGFLRQAVDDLAERFRE